MEPKEEVHNDAEPQQKKGFLRLRSANHNEDTCSGIAEDYRSGKFTDFVFICGDDASQVMRAHRLILSKASDYFKKVIESASNISFGYPIIPMIALKEVPNNDLKAIVDFIYEGKITIPKKQLHSVVKTAQFLQVNGLQHLSDKNVRSNSPSKSNLLNFSEDSQLSQDSNMVPEIKPNVYEPKIDPSLIPKLDHPVSSQITINAPDVVISRSSSTPDNCNVVNLSARATPSPLASSTSLPLNQPIILKSQNTAKTEPTVLTQRSHPQILSLLNKQQQVKQPASLQVNNRPLMTLRTLQPKTNNVQCTNSSYQRNNAFPFMITTQAVTHPNIVYPQVVISSASQQNISNLNLQPIQIGSQITPSTILSPLANTAPVTTFTITKNSIGPQGQVSVQFNTSNESTSVTTSPTTTTESSVTKSSTIVNHVQTSVSQISDKQSTPGKVVINLTKTTTNSLNKELNASDEKKSPENLSENVPKNSDDSHKFVDEVLPGVIFEPSQRKRDETVKKPSTVTPTLIRPVNRAQMTKKSNTPVTLIQRQHSASNLESPSKRHKPDNELANKSTAKLEIDVDGCSSTSNGPPSGVEEFKEPEEIWLDLY